MTDFNKATETLVAVYPVLVVSCFVVALVIVFFGHCISGYFYSKRTGLVMVKGRRIHLEDNTGLSCIICHEQSVGMAGLDSWRNHAFYAYCSKARHRRRAVELAAKT